MEGESLTLNIGVTFAIFKLSGQIKQMLQKFTKQQSLPKQLLIMLKLISLCPQHLFVFIGKIGPVGIVKLDSGT